MDFQLGGLRTTAVSVGGYVVGIDIDDDSAVLFLSAAPTAPSTTAVVYAAALIDPIFAVRAVAAVAAASPTMPSPLAPARAAVTMLEKSSSQCLFAAVFIMSAILAAPSPLVALYAAGVVSSIISTPAVAAAAVFPRFEYETSRPPLL